MLIQGWTNVGLPDEEQFGALREQMLGGPIPMRLERPGVPSTTAIPADLKVKVFGSAACLIANSGPAMGIRDKRQIARTDVDFVCIIEPFERGAFLLDGRSVPAGPGDLLLADSDTELVGSEGAEVRFRLWTLERGMAAPLLSRPHDRLSARVDGSGAMGGLLKGFLAHLEPALEAAGPEAREALLRHLAGLLAVERGVAKPAMDLGRDAVGAAKLVLAKRLVLENLSDPRLTPSFVAGKLAVSLRRLHTLFEPTGVTFSEYITSQRLERCHAALRDPAQARRSVTEIALLGGFESMATFYRAFRRRYGHPPGDLR